MSKLLELQFEFNNNFSKLLDFLRNKNCKFKVGEVLRTKEQAEIYAKQGKGIINSQHCDNLAFDVTLFKWNNEKQAWEAVNDSDFYRNAGNYWKTLNSKNRWGGDWKNPNDPYHFEMEEN